MSQFNPEEGKPVLAWISPEACVSDHRYQRVISGVRRSQGVIDKILKDFSWSKFGAVAVADNGDGSYCVIDGQHRVAAAKAHPAVAEIPALVIEAETLAEQAGAFLAVNRDRVRTNPLQEFHARVAAKEPEAVEIRDICARADVKIARSAKISDTLEPNETMAIKAIAIAAKRYGAGPTENALKAIRAAYPNFAGELRAATIKALAEVYYIYGGQVRIDRMAEVLLSKSAVDREDAARVFKNHTGGSTQKALREVLVLDYNRLRGGPKLEDPAKKKG